MKNTVDIKEVNRTQFYSFYVLLIFKFNIKFSPISFLTKPEYQTNNISLNDNEAQYLELIYKHNTDIEEKAQDFYNRTGKGVLKLKDYYREILHNK